MEPIKVDEEKLNNLRALFTEARGDFDRSAWHKSQGELKMAQLNAAVAETLRDMEQPIGESAVCLSCGTIYLAAARGCPVCSGARKAE